MSTKAGVTAMAKRFPGTKLRKPAGSSGFSRSLKRCTDTEPAKAGTTNNTARPDGGSGSTLEFVNRQRSKPLDLRLLRKITEAVLTELPNVARWELTFHLVSARRMAEINQTHLNHTGPTDVITFDYTEPETRNPKHALLGEIFICPAVAVTQAHEFRTTWQSELVRYLIHALLHLCGYDDLAPAPRRQMKQVENRLVRKFGKHFNFAKLAR